jgi:hypothetical protein
MADQASIRRLSPLERWERSLYGAIALLPLMGGIGLSHGLSLPLPGCPLMKWIGIPCPGWGLTRSVLALARGDWQGAIAFHAFGPLIVLACIGIVIHASREAWWGYAIPVPWGRYLRHPKFQIGAFLVLLGYHSTRLYALWQAGKLLPAFLHSPIGQWWQLGPFS